MQLTTQLSMFDGPCCQGRVASRVSTTVSVQAVVPLPPFPRALLVHTMDIVALRGFLDDETLLLLSTADSRTVTRPTRRNAMKRQMQAQRAMRAHDERRRQKMARDCAIAHDRIMAAQFTLAVISRSETLADARGAALQHLRAINEDENEDENEDYATAQGRR